jgi:hypothetical protein
VLLDHREAFEVTLDAGGEIVVSVALDDSELLLSAPSGPHLAGVRSDRRRQAGPLGPHHEQNGSHEENDRKDPHARIVVAPRARFARLGLIPCADVPISTSCPRMCSCRFCS